MKQLTCLLFVCAGAIAWSAENLSALIASTLRDHPMLASARADVSAASAQRNMALSMFRPQLSLNGFGATGPGAMIFSGTVDPYSINALESGDTGMLNGMFMWKLFSSGRDRAVGDAGLAAIRAGGARTLVAQQDVLLGLRTAFAEALLKRDTTVAHHAAHYSAEELVKFTEARFQAGKAPEAFVLRAKADLAAALSDVAMAEADEAEAEAKVWEAAGRPQPDKSEIGEWDTPLSAPANRKEAIALALKQRPELLALRTDAEKARLEQRAADRSRLPELSFLAMDNWSAARDRGAMNDYKLGFVLSLPVGDGGRRKADHDMAGAMISRSEAELKAMQNKVEAEVAGAWAKWIAADKIAEAAAAQVIASAEAQRIVLLRFGDGKAVLAEVLDANSAVVHAQLAVATATMYRRVAWSALTRATSEPSLNQPTTKID